MTLWIKPFGSGKFELHFGYDIEVVIICSMFELFEFKYVLSEAGF